VIKVFVSYSRDDESLVAPIVRLLRVNTSYVFQDIDGIRPGKRWREEITRGIAEADLVVVFWCRHAVTSASVSEEWTAAIEQKKDVLPLLLDATPLPKPLSDFQYIDFRATVGANHGAATSSEGAFTAGRDLPASAPRSVMRPFAWGGVAAALFVVVALMTLWPLQQETAFEQQQTRPPETAQSPTQPSQVPPVDEKPLPVPSPAPPPQPPASSAAWSPAVVVAVLAGLALAVAVIWRRVRKRRPPPPRVLKPRPSSRWEHTGGGAGIEGRMATEIEAEISRRTRG
jgi:membrane protein implicated in regulation of membrane protease activity